MGWNGVQTYGLRVDSARLADTATNATTAANYLPLSGGTITGSLTVNSTLTGVKNATNSVTGNLGNPTVEEMALFHGEYTNKLRFLSAYLQEESTDGIT